MVNNIDAVPELGLRKQISEDHDTECALKAGELIELGFMGEEFSNYGTGYLEKNVAKYFVCNHEQTMHRFRRSCLLNGYCMTQVIYNVERYQVPVGRNDFFGEQVRRNLANNLQQRYGKSFFKALLACQQTAAIKDNAWKLVDPLLTELRNSLDEHLIQIVYGLAEDAYEMRKLTREHYWHVVQWAQKEYRKISPTEFDSRRYRRTYYGFSSLQQGNIQYYVNASLFSVQQKKRDRISSGAIVSPILEKNYVSDTQERLLSYRKDFQKILRMYLNRDFMEDLQELWELPSSIDVNVYREGIDTLEKIKKQESLKDYLYYGHIWNTV